MKAFFMKVKEKMRGSSEDIDIPEEIEEGYVEVGGADEENTKAKITLRSYALDNFEAIKPILDDLREGYTIALVNIKPLKDKDIVELKRSINKLKKTCDAIEGDIAGFGDDWIAITPSFARIYREVKAKKGTTEINPEEF